MNLKRESLLYILAIGLLTFWARDCG